MFQKIIVPLDGSELAECALPCVEELAKGCGTKEVILISVTEHISGYKPEASTSQPVGLGFGHPVEKVPLSVGKMQRQAQKYLNKKAKGFKVKDVEVRTEVLLGNPAEEIVSFAEESGADIIVMSSHGRSGPSRWAHGSIADKVFRATCIPIMMVRAPGCMLST